MNPALDTSLCDLMPSACAQGGEFYGTSVMRVPIELPPQKILHWVAGSALASIDFPFCKRLVDGMVDLGADFLTTTALRQFKEPTYKSQKACILCRIEDRPDGKGFQTAQTTLSLTHASPLGAAMTAMNTPAFELMVGSIEASKAAFDISRPVVITKSGDRLDAWGLAATLRFTSAPSLLDKAFGVSGWSNQAHAERLGEAILIALKDNEAETRVCFSSDRRGLSNFAMELLFGGAALSPKSLLTHNIDPAWLVLMATRLEDEVASRLVTRLAGMDFPMDLRRQGTVSPLHAACTQGKGRTLAALLEAGANASVKDAKGQTLETLANEHHPQMMSVMRSWTLRKLAMQTMQDFFSIRKDRHPSN